MSPLPATALFIATISCCLATPAMAAITQVSTPVTVMPRVGWAITANYNGFVENQPIAALKAQTIFTLKNVSLDQKTWVFDITSVRNLTVGPTTSRVSVFGFDIDNDSNPANGSAIALLNTSSTTSTIFSSVARNGNIPQTGGATADICFRAGGNGSQCSGGGGGGVLVGDAAPSIVPTFTLKLQNPANSLTFNNMFVRYQSITGVDEGDSGVGLVETISFFDPLPEPGVWVQMIAGFGLVGAVRRRQRRALTG